MTPPTPKKKTDGMTLVAC